MRVCVLIVLFVLLMVLCSLRRSERQSIFHRGEELIAESLFGLSPLFHVSDLDCSVVSPLKRRLSSLDELHVYSVLLAGGL